MKVRMFTIMAGPEISASPGDVIDVDEKTAATLIAAGSAERYVQGEPVGRQTAKSRSRTAKGRETAATKPADNPSKPAE